MRANTLLLEYRRDVGRYLRGERDTYPAMPAGYSGKEDADKLTVLRKRPASSRNEDLPLDSPALLAEERLANTWRPAAARIYANWLAYLSGQKQPRLKKRLDWQRLRIPGEADSAMSFVENPGSSFPGESNR